MTAPGRIDLHHHAIVPKIARLMRDAGVPFTLPWSLEQSFDVMGRSGVQTAVVSNAIPDFFDGPEAAGAFHRAANEAVAELVRDHPDRFGLFAAVPMPHRDAALAECAHAFDVLGADGVVLAPQAAGKYLGDPLFDPLFAELDRRRAVVLVHPQQLPGGPADGIPYHLADFLLDTVRGALGLILSGALDRYPHIEFVLSHAGGFLPYAAFRAERLAHASGAADREKVAAGIKRFHYDLALSAPSALPSLLAAVGPERVVYGSDWCAVPEEAAVDNARALDAGWPGATEEQRRLVDRDNALRLLPGLAARIAHDPMTHDPMKERS
ncbi:amidohydrolase family protein [Streptomyces sp. NPDC001262]|uniref:amidohydrolase family protein n=1 Tax=Streptomyces TaxID=1883 RepID=UPI00367F11EB